MNQHMFGAHLGAVHVQTDPKLHGKGFVTEVTVELLPTVRQNLQSEHYQASCLLKQKSQHSAGDINITWHLTMQYSKFQDRIQN